MGAIERSPFLAKVTTPRTAGDEIPGYYSPDLDMWVIDTPTGVKPIISQGVLSELLTKTKVNAEQDDEAPWHLESLTETYQQAESDEESALSREHLLQLMTKTDAVTERDDRSEANHILELITKTNVELEHDDNGDPTFGLDTRYYEG